MMRLKKASRSPRFDGISQSLHSRLLSVSPAQGSIGCFGAGFRIASQRGVFTRSSQGGLRASRGWAAGPLHYHAGGEGVE
jgi:hypothetical protein